MTADGLKMSGDPIIYIELARTYLENNDLKNALSMCENATHIKMSLQTAEEAYKLMFDILSMMNDYKRMEFELENIKEFYGDELYDKLKSYFESKKQNMNTTERSIDTDDIDDDDLVIEHSQSSVDIVNSNNSSQTAEKEELNKTEEKPDKKIYVHHGGGDKEKLQSILKEMDSIDGVIGVILITDEGFLISSRMYRKMNIDSTVLLISGVCSTANEAMNKSQIGDLQRGVIEFGKGRIYIFKGNGYYFVMISDDSVEMGLVMIKIKKIVSKINEVL